MASITALNVSSTANKNQILFSSSISLIPKNFYKLTSVSFPNQNRDSKIKTLKLFSVRAMGGVKFKGTVEKDKQLSEMIEKKVQEATQVCGENNPISDECKVAWDEVEEISQAKADFRKKIEKEDPLESFCNENPETDECRVYED
ncbi:hypothetical protein MKW94_002284 [Papaver nudicaule]|uniref:CP12 domain-containing protein n=1 Tax=Papaver nudicaule TaxID=74823 RepID=A0AA41VNH0_PAPNU|nr:hypothetical protein [Papaver nudicaule]